MSSSMNIVMSKSPDDAYRERALKIMSPHKVCDLGITFEVITKKRIILPPRDKVLLSAGPVCTMPRNGIITISAHRVCNPGVLVYIQSGHGGLFSIVVENFSPRDVAVSKGDILCEMKLMQRSS